MFEKILKIRHLYLLAVVFTLISSVFFLVGGAIRSIHGYAEFIRMWAGDASIRTPGLHLAEGLDAFLLALVFLIFGLGIMKTFTHYHVDPASLPGWLHINSFKELKILLWETILVTLVVFSIGFIVRDTRELTWSALVLPGVILILSVSLYVVKRDHHGRG